MKNTIVFDLDGTLCDITHRLPLIKCAKPDWDAFSEQCIHDQPKPEIIYLFQRLQECGHRMLVVSGRSDWVRAQTEHWLDEQGVHYHELIMRPHGDHTKDDSLKRQWLCDGKLGDRNDILFCVDDRQRIVDMWRAEGLVCLQVDSWREFKWGIWEA